MQRDLQDQRHERRSRNGTLAAASLLIGLVGGWVARGDADGPLPSHAISGVVTAVDADGFCVRAAIAERCARMVWSIDLPSVGDEVYAEWVAFPSEDEGVLLWERVEPSR